MASTPDLSPEHRFQSYLELDSRHQELIEILATNVAGLNAGRLRQVQSVPASRQPDFKGLLKKGLLLGFQKHGDGMVYECHPELINPIMRRLSKNSVQLEKRIFQARTAWPLEAPWTGAAGASPEEHDFVSARQLSREVRIGLYRGDFQAVDHCYARYEAKKGGYWGSDWHDFRTLPSEVFHAVINPLDLDWMASLSHTIQRRVLSMVVQHLLILQQFGSGEIEKLIEMGQRCGHVPEELALSAVMIGSEGRALDLLQHFDQDHPTVLSVRGVLALLHNAEDFGISWFEKSLSAHQKKVSDKKGYPPGVLGLWHILALLLRNQPQDLQRAETLLPAQLRQAPAFEVLSKTHGMIRGLEDPLVFQGWLLFYFPRPDQIFWGSLLGLIVLARQDVNAIFPMSFRDRLRCWRELFDSWGQSWAVAETIAFEMRLSQPVSKQDKEKLEAFRRSTGWTLLSDHTQIEEPWQKALKHLRAPDPSLPWLEAGLQDAPGRLAWVLGLEVNGRGYRVEARDQRKGNRGWQKGMLLPLNLLCDPLMQPGYLTEQDRQVIEHISYDPLMGGYYLTESGLLLLSGHPAVYWQKDNRTELHVELRVSLPELRIQRVNGDRFRLEMWPHLNDYQVIYVELQADGILRWVPLKPEHLKLRRSIGSGFEAPLEVLDQVLGAIQPYFNRLQIHSELETLPLEGVPHLEADAIPHLRLIPTAFGLNFCLGVRPLGMSGPFLRLSSGPRTLTGLVEGKIRQVLRDPQREWDCATRLLNTRPQFRVLHQAVLEEGCAIEDFPTCVEVLLELRHLTSDMVVLEWPKGETLQETYSASQKNFRMQVFKQRDWFAISGELRLDSGDIIQMQVLLDLVKQQDGRFIKLDDGRLLALTREFRERLDELNILTEPQLNGERRLHPLALVRISSMSREFDQIELDDGVKQRIERMETSQCLDPKIPPGLTVPLRDYQRAGYVWLSRLAEWGVGACLADDMGLGKTIQSIALVLARAMRGPTLIIAPTSVVSNWHTELERFAPDLQVAALGVDRSKQIMGLGPHDVLVVSHGLLQQEAAAELLSGVKFSTIVVDEAQAFKNAATRRSRALMSLSGEFRLILTGTPIENHLGDLWGLFRFINPGLLGSQKVFSKRFIEPLTLDPQSPVRQYLKTLIQPFILRRTKSQVLTELPACTEIELKVRLGSSEAAFYEALRLRLVAQLERLRHSGEDYRFHLLSALTELRRACCNPNLVAPELNLPSAKLALLSDTLDELLENQHKVLIFSQFVDHLALVRATLSQRGISYQYLDGSTPQKARKQSIEAFQAGKGDVFLISLKAGGSGINLTAADYVIHLDPWWNPAVEDQASSRAHRMGQRQPVTVYRLIVEGTIEEQIVRLHHAKRELAESLLEGGDLSARMDVDDLLSLLKQGWVGHPE